MIRKQVLSKSTIPNRLASLALLKTIFFLAFMSIFSLGLTYATAVAQTKLSRPDAKAMIIESPDFAKYTSQSIWTNSQANQRALEMGVWTSRGGFNFNLNPDYSFAIAPRSSPVLLMMTPAMASKFRTEVAVTGIMETTSPSIKFVEFDWRYLSVPTEIAAFAVQGGIGQAQVRLYDDGWRINELKVQGGGAPYEMTNSDIDYMNRRVLSYRQSVARRNIELQNAQQAFVNSLCKATTPTEHLSTVVAKTSDLGREVPVQFIFTDVDLRVRGMFHQKERIFVMPYALWVDWSIDNDNQGNKIHNGSGRSVGNYDVILKELANYDDAQLPGAVSITNLLSFGKFSNEALTSLKSAFDASWSSWERSSQRIEFTRLPGKPDTTLARGNKCAVSGVEGIWGMPYQDVSVESAKPSQSSSSEPKKQEVDPAIESVPQTISSALEAGLSGTASEGSLSYSVKITKIGDTIEIAYPELNCTGVWQLHSEITGKSVFQEQIVSGGSNCASGYSSLTQMANGLYVWSWSRTPNGIPTAQAVLQ